MCHKLREASPRLLYDRGERARAKLARIARCNVHFGGASALTLANRIIAMGGDSELLDVVSAAYTSNTGNAPGYLAYHCPECDSVHAGENAARECCAQTDELDQWEDETEDETEDE